MLLYLCLVVAACARDTLGAPTARDDDDDDRSAEREPRDAASSERDAGPRLLGRIDAGTKPAPAAERDCTPGAYEGEFTCLISGLLPWGGRMSFSLVEESENAGEFLTLQIVPGTRLAGTDETFQGSFSADLKGSFDCRSGQLTGSLENGVYLIQGATPLSMTGKLSGVYQSDAGTPQFKGSMGPLESPDFALFGALAPSAMCDWTALRTGDAPAADAGRGR